MKLIISFLLVFSTAFSIGQQKAEELFNSAVYQEEITGNLERAIALYKQLVTQYAEDRLLTARSYLHLGIAHEKLGKPNAYDYYQTVIRQYSDQIDVVDLARDRLEYVRPRSKTGVIDIKMKQIWEGGDDFGYPSPDGKYFVHVNWANGNMTIRDLVNGLEKEITTRGTWKTGEWAFGDRSVWSPKGDKIAYTWYGNSTGQTVQLYDVKSGKVSTIIEDNKSDNRDTFWPSAWSPDGRYLAGLIQIKKKEGSRAHDDMIALYDLQENKTIELQNLGQIHTSLLTFTNDGKNLLFSAKIPNTDDPQDIYILNIENNTLSTLLDHPADESHPLAIPGTNSIVFLSDRSGNRSLWKVKINGAEVADPVLIKQLSAGSTPLAFTKNGNLFYSEKIPDQYVFTADIDFKSGKLISGPTKIPQKFEGINSRPFYSPNGQYLAYFSNRTQLGENNNVYVVTDLATGNTIELGKNIKETLHANNFRRGPGFVPGNNTIYTLANDGQAYGYIKIDLKTGFKSDSPATGRDLNGEYDKSGNTIYRIGEGNKSIISFNTEFDPASKVEVYKSGTEIVQLKLSPDGDKLAFLTGTGEMDDGFYKTTEIMVYDLKRKNVSSISKLTDGSKYRYRLNWSPDGNYLVTGIEKDRQPRFVIQPVNGGKHYSIDLDFEPSKFPRFITVHPKQNTIAYSSGNRRTDIWVMENISE